MEDERGDINVQGVRYRLLGLLKNGETRTFEIGEEEQNLFVFFTNSSKNYCNDTYLIPAGMEDVQLSGMPRYNPVNGGAFRFDGEATEVQVKNRKRSTRAGIIVLVAAVVVGIVIGLWQSGLFDGPAKPKEFTYAGMSITLTNKFTEENGSEYADTDYDMVYNSGSVAVATFRETFASLPDEYNKNTPLTEYARLLLAANDMPANTEIKSEDGLVWFEDEYSVDDGTIHNFTMVYKSADAFWMFQFMVYTEDLNKYRPLIMEWAKSVTFE